MKYSQILLSSLLIVFLFGVLLGCNSSKKSEIKTSGKPIESTVPAQDGVSISYDVRGEGKTTLVFIHGWCSNRTFWREQLDVMASNYRVVAIDLPGHGKSGRTRENWSFVSFAEDVKAVVEALDLNRVVLIGHSMGGPISLEAAQLMPERVIGIIGVDGIDDVESEDSPEMMERIIAAFEADFEGTMNAFMPRMFSANADSELVRWAIDSSVNADHVMALAVMRSAANMDKKKQLSSVGIPVRCIYAPPYDPNEPRTIAETNSKYADFNAVFIEGVGHFLHLENPAEVNRHILTFIEEIERLSH